MTDSNTLQALVLTNTIITGLCIILLVALTVFIILFLIPSMRRQWFKLKDKVEIKTDDASTFNRQPSFNNETYGTSRFNPIFESPSTITAPPPQFGTLFHPHATTATLLHPTIWTTMTPATAIASHLNLKPAATAVTTQTSAPSSLRDNQHPQTMTTAPRMR